MQLIELINKHGKPKALLDDWDKTENPKAIFDFEEIFFINNNGIPFLNDKQIFNEPLTAFQQTLDRWKNESEDLAAIGYISYDLKNLLYPHLSFNSNSNKNPLLWFAKPKMTFNYQNHYDSNECEPIYLHMIQNLPTPNEYEKFIDKIKTYLEIGDSYQINFTQQKKYVSSHDSLTIYLSMRQKIKPWHGMYINSGQSKVLSFSPEKFFKTFNGKIESFPMKGTRPRSSDPIKDELLKIELHKSKKDRAEHLMIVDLIRNDIGKICEFGSVNVENLYDIETFETVHQMVSKVYGKLSSNIKEIEIIKAMFPGGSITGAPKERSMKIIDSLENYDRGIYTGALGSISNAGEMNFNIAIRTMEINGNIATYPVGGGIVWDSDSMSEWEEAQQKSKIIDLCNENVKSKKHKLETC